MLLLLPIPVRPADRQGERGAGRGICGLRTVDSEQITEQPGCAAFGTSQKPDVRRLCRASGFFRVITDFCLASKPAECARRRKWQASACFSPFFADGPLLRADCRTVVRRPLCNPSGAAEAAVFRLRAVLSGRNRASMAESILPLQIGLVPLVDGLQAYPLFF